MSLEQSKKILNGNCKHLLSIPFGRDFHQFSNNVSSDSSRAPNKFFLLVFVRVEGDIVVYRSIDERRKGGRWKLKRFSNY